jgi:PKD repeat protein
MMMTHKKIYKMNKVVLRMVLLLVAAISMPSCDFEYDLPETGSLPDLTPPSANFDFAATEADFLTFNFANLSSSATDFNWEFGDGNMSTDFEPSHSFPDVGTYTVTLTASDKLGVVSTLTQEVLVEEPEAPEAILPVISESSFEDNSDIAGCGTAADGRDCWRISGGKIFGITSGPVRTGSQGAKFDAGDPRVGYQALNVSPNTDYIVSVYYTMKTSPAGGEVRLAVLGKAIGDASEAEDAIIASVTGNNQDNSDEFIQLTVSFNSGDSSTIAIWLDSNNIAEARMDDVSIELVQ